MEPAALVFLTFVGTLFPPLNPETTAAVFATRTGWPIWQIGLLYATGQTLGYALLAVFGARLVPRWAWLAGKVESVKVRFADHLERRYLLACAVGGFLGIPPASPLAVLAPGFGVPLAHLLPVMWTTRFVRALLLGAFGKALLEGWHVFAAWWQAW
jgi:hypothetical protein